MATKKLGTTLKAINAQIAALQASAEAIRKKEAGEVLAKIKDAIAHYGLTAADLGLHADGAAPRAAKAANAAKAGRKGARKAVGPTPEAKTVRAAKYADGQGRVWGGMGKRPDWFKAALASGRTAEELLGKK